jgi:predicted GIY-YIG superfamily endonuclease
MEREKQYYVYIMTNKSKTLYVGITNNIKKRVYGHKNKLVPGFTKKYNITRLIYFETFAGKILFSHTYGHWCGRNSKRFHP